MFTRRSATDTTASDLQKLAADCQQALLRQVLPFWLEHSPDAAYGGYFDWLTTTGAVIEGDKSVVRQAQQAYAFARLYNTVDAQAGWLDHARLGVTFLSRFAHGDRLHCYDQLDRLGHPVALATTNEPDAYTLMAYAQFHRATNEDEWAMLAKSLLTNVLADLDDARAEMMAVRVPTIRQGRYLRDWITGVRAMLSSRHLLDDDSWKDGMTNLVQGIQQLFVDRRTDTVRAYVQNDGGYINTPEGRRVDVGLTLQLTNALFDYCELVPNRKLAQQAAGWCLYACEQAWDETAGGLRNFVDHKTQPTTEPDAYRWAWVMVEGLLALSKSYLHTRHADCLKWLRRLHEYTFAVFPNAPETGWHLAVDTNRQPVWPTKASPLVDCYMLMCNLADAAKVLQRMR